ncbi:MAG: hypothetical protein ACOYKE_02080 [Ferruginibacter sp.]
MNPLKLIPAKFSGTACIAIFSLSIIFHVLVLLQIIPYSIVWGGNIQHSSDMIKLEVISIVLNGFFIVLLLSIMQVIKSSFSLSMRKWILGIMVAIFLLNTIGNLFSKQTLETLIFTPITFLLAVFCWSLFLHQKAYPAKS